MSQALTPSVGPQDHAAGGGAEAPLTLVEYGDYECPHCGRAFPIVEQVRQHFGDRLRFVFRHFPLSEVHPHAFAAAQAAEAAAQQGKFWDMHALLFTNQRALGRFDVVRYAQHLKLDGAAFEAAWDGGDTMDRVQDDFDSGIASGVNGTPTFFLNGHTFEGPWGDEAQFIAALEAELRAGH